MPQDGSPQFTIEPGFREEHRPAAAKGFWAAFGPKLARLLGPTTRAVDFIESVLDPSHAISAVDSNGDFLGVAGFKTDQGAFVGGTFRDLRRVYGSFGALWRAPLLSILERDLAPDTLLMDGIFVAPSARGMGVGSALLTAVSEHATALGLAQVRLDVIDSNPRARALYERQGFKPLGKTHLGPFKHLFGFQSATTMTRETTA